MINAEKKLTPKICVVGLFKVVFAIYKENLNPKLTAHCLLLMLLLLLHSQQLYQEDLVYHPLGLTKTHK